MATATQCEWCEGLLQEDEHFVAYDVDGDEAEICTDCYRETEVCDECREAFEYEGITYVSGYPFCPDCLVSETITCNDCGQREIDDDVVTVGPGLVVCDDCFRENYYQCEGCEDYIHRDDAFSHHGEPLCEGCYDEVDEDRSRGTIRGACYRPAWRRYYHPDEEMHGQLYGIELEVDRGGCSDYKADEVLEVIGEDFAIAKEDGSLASGWELVTHPASFEYHMQEVPWGDVLERLKELDYVSHDSNTAGIHVHISRTAFGNDDVTQDLGIAKMLYLIEKYWSKWRRFARRSRARMAQWAAKYIGDEGDDVSVEPTRLLHIAKSDRRKYTAVNISNSQTVEIRIFRGSLRYQSFMAALELTDSLVNYVNHADITEIQSISWDELRDKLSQGYENLGDYFVYRNL